MKMLPVTFSQQFGAADRGPFPAVESLFSSGGNIVSGVAQCLRVDEPVSKLGFIVC